MAQLKVGVDVPWVTSWTAEPDLGVAPCPSVDGVLAVGQKHAPGQGKPQYSRNHLVRQRRTVRELLCPMCGVPTQAGDRWSQTGRYVAAGELRAKGLGSHLPTDMADDRVLLDVGAIAPLHRACAERSMTLCPHLSGRSDHTLKPFPGAWVVTPLTIEARPPAGPLAAPVMNVFANPQPIRKPIPVVTFLQLCGVTDDHDPAWRSKLEPAHQP